MSLTGLHLRRTVRRGLARGLEALAAVVDVPERTERAPEPATVVPEPAAPAPKAPEPAKPLPPLPAVDKPKPPTPAELAAARTPGAARPPAETSAGAAARVSPEDRQRQHWERTRRGLLLFVHEQGGRVSLRDLHEHSDKTYHVAHVGFSRMMEELTDQGLLAYDHDTALAAITEAGRAEMA
jgi:hypothetical protein